VIDRVGQLQPAGGVAPGGAPAAGGAGAAGSPFGDVLARKLAEAGPLRFSGHALDRIQRREISLDDAALARLGDGVARAAAKGGRESLVLVDGTAFVVSVPNKTVVTAVDPAHMRQHVFTNIDTTVIA